MWPLAVVMGDPAFTVFLIRKCIAVLHDRKKVAVITSCPYYRHGRKARFHCILSCLFLREPILLFNVVGLVNALSMFCYIAKFVSCFFRTQLYTGAPVRPLTRLRRCICRLKLTSIIVSGAHPPHITEREIFNFLVMTGAD